jgi:hypothetical protein
VKARKATAAEKTAVAAFVPGLLHVTSDGIVALFAVGSKTRQGFTRENKSVLAIFEFLAKQEPPPGTFQAAIDCLAGARSKKLDGMRRVLGIVIETDRDQVIKLLRRDELALVLKEEHAEALETDEATVSHSRSCPSSACSRRTASTHKQARQDGATGRVGRGVIARIILYPSYFSITNSQLK